MDKIDFRLPEQDVETFVRETQEDLELLRQMEEEEARLYGGPPPGQVPLIDASSIGAPPEPCWRCGADMAWDYDNPGFYCHKCGRRLSLIDGALRVVETGSGEGSVAPISAPAMIGPEIRGPEDSTVVLGAPRQCPNCGEQMEYVISLPGYHCWICGRGEMVVNERLTVLTPGAEEHRASE